MWDMMMRCWNVEAPSRPTMVDVLKVFREMGIGDSVRQADSIEIGDLGSTPILTNAGQYREMWIPPPSNHRLGKRSSPMIGDYEATRDTKRVGELASVQKGT